MKCILIFVCIAFAFCTTGKKSSRENQLSMNITSCGSYEVRKANVKLGYLVNSLEVVKIPNELYLQYFTSFEAKVLEQYSSSFNKFKRIYHFTLSSDNDTILIGIMIREKRLESHPDWKCNYQAVEEYFKGDSRKETALYFNTKTQIFQYGIDR